MKTIAIIAALTWAGLWFTPDQQGRRHFERGEFTEAAAVFQDPLWQGTAFYRAGEFEKAARAFARRDTAEAHYNQGSAWLMNGKYEDAIDSYDRALAKRPGWQQAADNRDLAGAVCIWKRFTPTQDEFASRGLAFLRDLFDQPLLTPRAAALSATA
jgi:Ca-activated chloride channel family protein